MVEYKVLHDTACMYFYRLTFHQLHTLPNTLNTLQILTTNPNNCFQAFADGVSPMYLLCFILW